MTNLPQYYETGDEVHTPGGVIGIVKGHQQTDGETIILLKRSPLTPWFLWLTAIFSGETQFTDTEANQKVYINMSRIRRLLKAARSGRF